MNAQLTRKIRISLSTRSSPWLAKVIGDVGVTRDRKRPVQAKASPRDSTLPRVRTVRFIIPIFFAAIRAQCTPTKRCRLPRLAVHEGLLHMPGKEVFILEFQCTCQFLSASEVLVFDLSIPILGLLRRIYKSQPSTHHATICRGSVSTMS
jgi:hypothetical protein